MSKRDSDYGDGALAWWVIALVLGPSIALASFLIWWPLLEYSWTYWTGG